ncbi:MAG TPA: hypothetical protein VFB72_06195 [Verrucomicrobiae bacterium]|nr:hypothetical protein [Verrucomicrobiae bacterium]
MKFKNSLKLAALAGVAATVLAPDAARACACGCSVFDVATSSMLPQGAGGMAYLEMDYQNQYRNWSGNSPSSAIKNPDKEIRTLFLVAGLQYFFNREWGIQVEVPYDFRTFKTESANPNAPPGAIAALQWSDIGDMRVKGIYTGFTDDLSIGLDFGLKLPTGSYTHNDAFGDVDRDTQLGTGSTDLLLGGFYRRHITEKIPLTLFAQTELDLPMLIRDDYRPGIELDSAVGVYYEGWKLGRVRITPVAQVIFSERTSDSGQNAANPVASGYQRLLLSPGLELHMHPISVYADVEFPVFQHMVGNQLVAPALFKLVFSYHF